jgi:hypothetical protein
MAALVGGPIVVIVALAWPLLFTSDLFNESWANQLWFLWHQSLTIRANHSPSLFLNYSDGVFYPEYLFYGATVFTVFGTLSLILGNAPTETYVTAYLIAFAAAYGGWYWLSRMAGLGRWQACAPGLVYVTSGYFITAIYARGDWPELLGISAVPLMIAAGLNVLRADRLRLWPAAALIGSTVVFFGAHNITILWGSTILTVASVAMLVCVPQTRRAITRSGVLRVAAVAVPALLVNAWFLLPDLVYRSHTAVGIRYQYAKNLLKAEMPLVSAGHLLSVWRVSALPGGGFVLSLPTLEIAWLLVGIALLLRTARAIAWTRILLVIAAIAVLAGVLMTHLGLLLALPSIYAQLEFSYRLETYVLLGVSGAMLAALAALAAGKGRDRPLRVWSWALVPILIVSVLGAIQQANSYKSGGTRAAALHSFLKPPLGRTGWADFLDLPQNWAPYPVASRAPEIAFPSASIHDDRISEKVRLPAGEMVRTNIAGAYPGLVHVTGARIVGIDSLGEDVLRIDSDSASPSARSPAHGDPPARAETISVSAGQPLPIVLGRLLTIIAALVLVGQLAALALRDLRNRKPQVGAEQQ